MNRRGEEGILQTSLIAILVVGAVVVLMSGFYLNLSTGYGVTFNNSEYTNYEQFDNIYSTVNETAESITNISGASDALVTVTEASYNTGMLVLRDVPAAALSIVQNFAYSFGLPPIFTNLILAVIMVLLLFGIINLIVKVFA